MPEQGGATVVAYAYPLPDGTSMVVTGAPEHAEALEAMATRVGRDMCRAYYWRAILSDQLSPRDVEAWWAQLPRRAIRLAPDQPNQGGSTCDD